MKKIMVLLLVLLLCPLLLTGCNSETQKPSPSSTADNMPEVVRVAALKGATAMGMVKLMQDNEDGTTELVYDFIITITDDIVPKITKGEIDIAAIPANLASVLYQNTEKKIQVLAINTLGVLYVVEKGDKVKSVADLKGKTIYSTGKGTTPEFALNYILVQNGIDPTADMTIEYKSEPAEIIPLLLKSENGIAMVPQPFVTTALDKVEGLRVALDWTEEWNAVSQDGSSQVTGVVVVRKEFVDQYPAAVAAFCSEYAASATYAQSNVAETAQLVEKYGIVDAAIAESALPACNITYIGGIAMQEKLTGYLRVLYEQNPQSVGGVLPDEGFFYIP